MEPDPREVSNLLKKSISRLHAVKDDLRFIADEIDDENYSPEVYDVAEELPPLIQELTQVHVDWRGQHGLSDGV